MQILRFEDAPEVAPKRKKSSAGWIGLGLVAALFGVSTAFASSTIAINGGNTINLAQGVVAVTGCDSDIGVLPSTSLVKKEETLGFDVTSLTVGFDHDGTGSGKIAGTCGNADGDNAVTPVDFKIQFYLDGPTPTAKTCTQMFGDDITKAEATEAGLTFLPTTASDIKCDGSALWFKMKPLALLTDKETFVLTLPAGFKASIFDYITLETSNTTY
jgi:hypothetical protein